MAESPLVLLGIPGGDPLSDSRAGYTASAVHFDGFDGPEQTQFARGATLTGVSNCVKVLWSVWVANIPVGNNYYMFASQSNGNFGQRSNTAQERGFAIGTLAGLSEQTTVPINGSSWVHVMGSRDYSDENKRFLFVNGVDVRAAAAYVDIGLLKIADELDFFVGSDGLGNYFTGDMADLWVGFDQYLDLSNPDNVAKFIADGKPVDLGANGELPTGTPPTIFGSGNATTFLQPNLGTGGAFTLTGPLTNASTSPSD